MIWKPRAGLGCVWVAGRGRNGGFLELVQNVEYWRRESRALPEGTQ